MEMIETIVVGPIGANCFVVSSGENGGAAIIDPGGDPDLIFRCVDKHGCRPLYIVNTHAHPDHTAANAEVCGRYGVPVFIHALDAPLLARMEEWGAFIGIPCPPSPAPERLLQEGDLLAVDRLSLKIIHTPGHSPGSICLYGKIPGGDRVLFAGDTVFAGSVGRTDLPGGSHKELIQSIQDKIISLPEETRILPGHGPATTVGSEKKNNPFFQRGERWI
jgi:glyoxylase-like metal-dependent hydrolase (beta-lactamase superfamily II)